MIRRYRAMSVIILVCAAIFLSPLCVRFFLQAQLRKLFPSSSVSVGSVSFEPFFTMRVSGIVISRQPMYEIRIPFLDIHAQVRGFLREVRLNVKVEKPALSVDSGAKSARSLSDIVPTGGEAGVFPVVLGTVAVEAAHLRIVSSDVNVEGDISGSFDCLRGVVLSARMNFARIEAGDCRIADAVFAARQEAADGSISVASITYNKAALRDVIGTVSLLGQELHVSDVRARLFKGTVRADLRARLVSPVSYSGRIALRDIDLAEITRDFNLKEKVLLDGSLSGEVRIAGTRAALSVALGELTAAGEGGMLTITDTRFLESMAQRSGSALDIVMESFKNYRYNNGTVKIGLDKNDLTLDAAMDGAAGKRDVTVVLHDIFLQ